MSEQTSHEGLEEWAVIFNAFGEKATREILYEAAMRLDANDEPRAVIEFFNNDGYKAIDITDHVDALEGVPTDENGLDGGDA